MDNQTYGLIVMALQQYPRWKDYFCKITCAPRPTGGHYIGTPEGNAVRFSMLGQHYVDLGDSVNARALAQRLRELGVYTQPADPNCGRRVVRAMKDGNLDE